MFNLTNLMAEIVYKTEFHASFHKVFNIIAIIVMAIAAISAIILILLQPSNSQGIDALGGSSETFFGKNKGKSIEAKMKKWTWICLIVLVVVSILFYVLSIPTIWGPQV